MLDDLKMIHERDAQDALGVAEKQWQQLKHDYKQNTENLGFEDCRDIVLAGMGGSALAASIFVSCPGAKVPFEIVRDYNLPQYADKNTLFIASSYSGNTEETLSALNEAEGRNCRIVVIASGGKLAEKAKQKDYPLFEVPSGYQPRMAVFYNYAALWQLLQGAGLAKADIKELHKTADWLGEEVAKFVPTVPTDNNPAKKLALELVGSSIVVYAGPKLFPAAYKWKINFNENAKTVAWCNQLPEFNHNEFLGWTSHPVDKPYKVIDLRSDLDNQRVQKRFEITEKLLSGKRPQPQTITPEGKTLLEQMLWTIQLGDFVSLYLALLNGLNPTPVDLIEKLKTELAA
jgi:glucose/mannose-6-phosphate isomerase